MWALKSYSNIKEWLANMDTNRMKPKKQDSYFPNGYVILGQEQKRRQFITLDTMLPSPIFQMNQPTK